MKIILLTLILSIFSIKDNLSSDSNTGKKEGVQKNQSSSISSAKESKSETESSSEALSKLPAELEATNAPKELKNIMSGYAENTKEKEKALMHSISKLDVDNVKKLLSEGIFVNFKIDGQSPIEWATFLLTSPGYFKIVSWDPDYTNIMSKEYQIVEALLDHGANPNTIMEKSRIGGRHPIIVNAAAQQRPDIVRLLLKHKANTKIPQSSVIEKLYYHTEPFYHRMGINKENALKHLSRFIETYKNLKKLRPEEIKKFYYEYADIFGIDINQESDVTGYNKFIDGTNQILNEKASDYTINDLLNKENSYDDPEARKEIEQLLKSGE